MRRCSSPTCRSSCSTRASTRARRRSRCCPPWPTRRNSARCGRRPRSRRASESRRFPLARAQRRGDLALVQDRAVVALDQQRDAALDIDVLRPAERIVECRVFLEQPAVLLERRDGLRAPLPAVNPVPHRSSPVHVRQSQDLPTSFSARLQTHGARHWFLGRFGCSVVRITTPAPYAEFIGTIVWAHHTTTLEWTLPSPPPFHQFETLPRIRA